MFAGHRPDCLGDDHPGNGGDKNREETDIRRNPASYESQDRGDRDGDNIIIPFGCIEGLLLVANALLAAVTGWGEYRTFSTDWLFTAVAAKRSFNSGMVSAEERSRFGCHRWFPMAGL